MRAKIVRTNDPLLLKTVGQRPVIIHDTDLFLGRAQPERQAVYRQLADTGHGVAYTSGQGGQQRYETHWLRVAEVSEAHADLEDLAAVWRNLPPIATFAVALDRLYDLRDERPRSRVLQELEARLARVQVTAQAEPTAAYAEAVWWELYNQLCPGCGALERVGEYDVEYHPYGDTVAGERVFAGWRCRNCLHWEGKETH